MRNMKICEYQTEDSYLGSMHDYGRQETNGNLSQRNNNGVCCGSQTSNFTQSQKWN